MNQEQNVMSKSPNENSTMVELNNIFSSLFPTKNLLWPVKIDLAQSSYLPKNSDPRYDWVFRVLIPSLKKLKEQKIEIKHFCSIGTGTGVDALAAVEIFSPEKVTVTDIDEESLDKAKKNLLANILESEKNLQINALKGDLAFPLISLEDSFDLIYENLPNIPIDTSVNLFQNQNAASYYHPQSYETPDLVKKYYLELHYHFLLQAKLIKKEKSPIILSSIGQRIPLEIISRAIQMTGYKTKILHYTWKLQSEPEQVISGYLRGHLENPEVDFFFYQPAILEEVFSQYPTESWSDNAYAIEEKLHSYRIGSAEAFKRHLKGEVLGHTVVMMQSEWKTVS